MHFVFEDHDATILRAMHHKRIAGVKLDRLAVSREASCRANARIPRKKDRIVRREDGHAFRHGHLPNCTQFNGRVGRVRFNRCKQRFGVRGPQCEYIPHVTVCQGCCCGNTANGRPPVPVDWLKKEWRARGLLKRVQLTISGCLGPCDIPNVVTISNESGTLWLGGIAVSTSTRPWLTGLLVPQTQASCYRFRRNFTGIHCTHSANWIRALGRARSCSSGTNRFTNQPDGSTWNPQASPVSNSNPWVKLALHTELI